MKAGKSKEHALKRLKVSRKSVNFSGYLVLDLEAGRFLLLGKNRLGPEAVEHELFTLVSLYNV